MANNSQNKLKPWKRILVFSLIALFCLSPFTGATHVQAEEDDVFYHTVGPFPDGKIHFQGTIGNMTDSVSSLFLYAIDENDNITMDCSQLISVGGQVVSQDARNGNFDLICEDTAPLRDDVLYVLLAMNDVADDTLKVDSYIVGGLDFNGGSLAFDVTLNEEHMESESDTFKVWELTFTNNTSYDIVSINEFSTFHSGSNYFPIFSMPWEIQNARSGNMSFYAIMPDYYRDHDTYMPSVVLLFNDAGFNNFGVYQIDEPDIDKNARKITIGAISNDDLVTSTQDFIDNIFNNGDLPAKMSFSTDFEMHFQDWGTWYKNQYQFLTDDWFEDAVTNYVDAPVDIDGSKALTVQYLKTVALPFSTLKSEVYASGVHPVNYQLLWDIGDNAYDNVKNQFTGGLAGLKTTFPQAKQSAKTLQGEMIALFETPGATYNILINTLVPSALANGDGELSKSDIENKPSPDVPATGTKAAAIPDAGWGERLKNIARTSLSTAKICITGGSALCTAAVAGQIWYSGGEVVAGVAKTVVAGILADFVMLIVWILSAFLELLLFLLSLVMLLMQVFMRFGEANNIAYHETIVLMWKAVRDFTNILFIFIFLGIAIANIVQFQMDNYAIKTMLPKVIVALIAINFSKLFVWFILTAVDFFETAVYSIAKIGPHGGGWADSGVCSQFRLLISGSPENIVEKAWSVLQAPFAYFLRENSVVCEFARVLQLDTWRNAAGGSAWSGTNLKTDTVGLMFVLIIMLVLICLVFFGFLALCVIFLARVIILWILTITAPLYFAAKPIPALSSIAEKWSGKFWKYAFMPVSLAFVLTLGIKLIQLHGSAKSAFYDQVAAEQFASDATMGPHFGFNDFLILIAWTGLVFFGVFKAVQSEEAAGLVNALQGAGKKTAKAVGLSVPLGVRFQKDPLTKKPDWGFYTARNVGQTAHKHYNAVKKGMDAASEKKSDILALRSTNAAHKTLGFIEKLPGGKLASLPGKGLQVHEAADRMKAAKQRGDAERADEFKKTLHDEKEHELYDTLRNPNLNPDIRRAILETLSERGLYDEKKVAIALKIHEGFGKEREKELESNNATLMTDDEVKILRDRLADFTGEAEYGSSLQNKSRDTAESRSSGWMKQASARADRLDDYIMGLIDEKENVDRNELLGAIRYGLQYGKGSRRGMIAMMGKAIQGGQLGMDDAVWLANMSGLNMKNAFVESFADGSLMRGQGNNAIMDVRSGEEMPLVNLLSSIVDEAQEERKQLLAEAKQLEQEAENPTLSPDDKASKMEAAKVKRKDANEVLDQICEEKPEDGGRMETIMDQIEEKSNLVKTRLGKINSIHDNVANLDHDIGTCVTAHQSTADALESSRRVSGGKGKRTKEGITNDMEDDARRIGSLRKMVTMTTGDRQVKYLKALKQAMERIAARKDTYYDEKVGQQIHGQSWDQQTAGDADVVGPNSGHTRQTFVDVADVTREVIRTKGANASKFNGSLVDAPENGTNYTVDAKSKTYKINVDASTDAATIMTMAEKILNSPEFKKAMKPPTP